jgi:outer membrane protein insertion porin family
MSRLTGLILVALAIISYSSRSASGAKADQPASKKRPYKIVFAGNSALGEADLRKAAAAELEAFAELGQRRADIDDAAFAMELAYRKAGYAFAAVDYRIEHEGGKLVVTFSIREGPRVIVKEIDIVGNKAFGTQKLLALFEGEQTGLFGQGKLLFVKSTIQSAVSQIRDFYLSQGYLNSVIEDPQISYNDARTRATVTVRIKEGTRYVILDIDFRGDVVTAAEQALKRLRQEQVGKPFFVRKKLMVQSQIVDIYGNLGYPRATAEVTEQQGPEPGNVVLTADIVKGPRVTISEIEIRGNEKTRRKFIRSRLLLKPGDRYSLDLQKQSFSRLYKTGLFSKVDFHLEEVQGTDKWPLVVEVQEAQAKEFYFQPGWGSYELLRLSAGYKDKNILGSGRILSLDGTVSIKSHTLVTTLTDPWFLNTDIRADLPVYYNYREEPSFTRQDVGGSILFSKSFTEHLSATGRYGFRATKISHIDTNEKSLDIPNDYNYASVEFQTTYDTRNDVFFPTTGQRFAISAERADTALGGEITLTRLTGEARSFTPLTRSTVLGLRYRTGLIYPGPDDFLLPIGERFFNGGENTVRSFKQSELGPKDESGKPIGGLAYNVFNIELRQRLIGNLTGSLFFDAGNVSPNRSRVEQGKPPYDSLSQVMSDTFDQYFSGFGYGVGFGLQYLLPVGPARVDFAFNPDRDSSRNEDSFVFVFAVGMAF